MEPAERLAHIRGISNHIPQVQIRGVQGGYVVQGSIQYSDKVTGGVLAAIDNEAVAGTPEHVGEMVKNFLLCGMFVPPPAPLFEGAGIQVPVISPPGAANAVGGGKAALDIDDQRRDLAPDVPGVI